MTARNTDAVLDGRRDIIRAVRAFWGQLQSEHPDLPDVDVRWRDPAPRGAFAVPQHLRIGPWQDELVLTDARIAHAAYRLIGDLRHEAAHSLANARNIAETSREGRYHNLRYRDLAYELGLGVAAPTGAAGAWDTWMEPVTASASLQSAAGQELERAVLAYRPLPTAEPPSKDDRIPVACHCVGDADRGFRITPAKLARGPITCGVCREDFRPVPARRKPPTARTR